MQATIISDTSCLILLEKIGALNLLQKLFGKIVTTQIVADEFGKHLPDWIRVQTQMIQLGNWCWRRLLIKVKRVLLL